MAKDTNFKFGRRAPCMDSSDMTSDKSQM